MQALGGDLATMGLAQNMVMRRWDMSQNFTYPDALDRKNLTASKFDDHIKLAIENLGSSRNGKDQF
jgi:hypothetical protein